MTHLLNIAKMCKSLLTCNWSTYIQFDSTRCKVRRPPMMVVGPWQLYRKIEREAIIRYSTFEGTNLKSAGHVVKRGEVHAYVMCTGGAARRGLRVRNACGQCVPSRHESMSLPLLSFALGNMS